MEWIKGFGVQGLQGRGDLGFKDFKQLLGDFGQTVCSFSSLFVQRLLIFQLCDSLHDRPASSSRNFAEHMAPYSRGSHKGSVFEEPEY